MREKVVLGMVGGSTMKSLFVYHLLDCVRKHILRLLENVR